MAKLETPVTYTFCMWPKSMISARDQGLLRFNHFVDPFTIMCKQTVTMHVFKQMKP